MIVSIRIARTNQAGNHLIKQSHKTGLKNRLFMIGVSSVILLSACQARQVLDKSLPAQFDGGRAYENVVYQVSLGPRIPGSPAHEQAVKWIVQTLQSAGWEADIQESDVQGHKIRNIIGKMGTGRPIILLGAHYDTRIKADHDQIPANRSLPVPGANDGASGVAVLLELARVLPETLFNLPSDSSGGTSKAGQIWLVFFDAEDNGNIPGWNWIMGSTEFVNRLQEKPDKAVIIDMIGDRDLDIYFEGNSDETLSKDIFAHASLAGYENQFIPKLKYPMLDDHIPFKNAGIPAVDLIDFDYLYYHTTQDTPDKVSPESLKAVGETLISWLQSYKQ